MMYYILVNGVEVGPMTAQQMMAYHVDENTQIRTSQAEPWRPLFTSPELMGMINNATAGSTTDKDKIVAGVLAILLGSIGVHYFYLDRISAGIITILLTLITCGLWSVITLVQGILMLTMSQQDFERKYIYSTSTLPLF